MVHIMCMPCPFCDSICYLLHLTLHLNACRSKSVNLDGSINNPLMHGNFTNIPIDMGSEWLYPTSKATDLESKYEE